MPQLFMPQLFMPHPSPTPYQFRPALPADRHQIRLLLRGELYRPGKLQEWSWFGLGVLLALGLHGLLTSPPLLYGMLMLGSVAAVYWLNQWLFEDWQDYWVVEQNNRLMACGKLTCYASYSTLCDVTVAIGQRRQGVGSFLVASIIHKSRQPLYLACTAQLVQFYQPLGFVALKPSQVTKPLKQALGLSQNSKLIVLYLEKNYPKKKPSGV